MVASKKTPSVSLPLVAAVSRRGRIPVSIINRYGQRDRDLASAGSLNLRRKALLRVAENDGRSFVRFNRWNLGVGCSRCHLRFPLKAETASKRRRLSCVESLVCRCLPPAGRTYRLTKT